MTSVAGWTDGESSIDQVLRARAEVWISVWMFLTPFGVASGNTSFVKIYDLPPGTVCCSL